MKWFKLPPLIFVLLSFPATLMSQDASLDPLQVYGMDQTLYNGKRYTFLAPYGTKGHPYLLSPDYMPGSVTIKEKTYKDLLLNYDIYNQQLLLMYVDEAGARNVIEVSKAWLKGFSLGNRRFELRDLGQQPQFYQVLGDGPVQILYWWRKNMDLDIAIGSNNFIFNRAVRDTFVFIDGELKPYKSKRSLVTRFDREHRPEIKRYMRKNKVNIRKGSDKSIEGMINFIGKLN